MKEENFYFPIKVWLNKAKNCSYVRIRKNIWGKQPDVIGIKFSKTPENLLKAFLYIIEVKVIDSLSSIYEVIGEIELKTALFINNSSMFYALYPYIAIFEKILSHDIQLYCKIRKIGLIKLKYKNKVLIELSSYPEPIILKNFISIESLTKEMNLNSDESRLLEEAINAIGWWKLKEFISR